MDKVSHRNHLVIMVKTPKAGRVKTRLAREIGAAKAVNLYRHQVKALIKRLKNDRRWDMSLAVTPDCDVRHAFWEDIACLKQGRGDLGKKMQYVMEQVKPGPVILIGADVPEIKPSHIAKAFRILHMHDAVFGPAYDGGYWLVGQKKGLRCLQMFANVRWSSEFALRDTLSNLEGKQVALTDRLADLDTFSDYEALKRICGRVIV